MTIKYEYDGREFYSVAALRKAIWEKQHIAFGDPADSAAWSRLGVKVVEINDPPIEPVTPDLDTQRRIKRALLESAFNTYRESSKTFLMSSLGFRANANVTAFNNVSGLVATLERTGDEKILFMTFDDEIKPLALDDLKLLLVEISQNGSHVYSQKWAIREQIESAKTVDDLDAIEIKFTPADFSKV